MSTFFNPRVWGETLTRLKGWGAPHLARATAALGPWLAPLVALFVLARANAGLYGRRAWGKLSPRHQDHLIDGAALARAALVWAWLALLSLTTVWTDFFGRSRTAIPVTVGRGRVPAEIQLTDAASPLQRRLLAYFWRNPHDQTVQALHALTLHYRGTGVESRQLDVSGVIVFPRVAGATRNLPLAFRVQIDLVAKTATLTHARAVAAEGTGATICAHGAAALPMNSASIHEVLSPLLGRNVCPALTPKQD